MILLFPNLDTLRLALTRTIVPPEVMLTPAAVTFDNQGKVYLEPTAALTRTVIKNLDKIGVKGSRRHANDHPQEVSCWPQVLPLVKEPGTPNVSNQAPVLFELSEADDLPTLATEMLRLGNDRQSFRWFAVPGDSETKRVLLRVIGPPYYTLLRALDLSTAGTKGTVRAYLERSPRVWVEIGHAHPLADQLRVADGQMLLIHAPREWMYLEDAAFQDVYDILQFKLPSAPIAWCEAPAPKKMTVPLRLTAGNAADIPELWVLRDRGIEQLDALVRDSDERLTQRLMFAIATAENGQTVVVLRTRPSKLPPPALPLENSLAFKPMWKLPNLFVPVGRRLHPTLRRDAVRRLLADNPDLVVWLYPSEGGGFTPESVPDGAFRSLEDWVDYIIESEQKPLATWIESTRFDFEYFVCKDTGGPKPKTDKGDKEPKTKDDADARGTKGVIPLPRTSTKGKPAPRPQTITEFLPEPDAPRPPSELEKLRVELEYKFKAIDGPLDATERVVLWPKLGAVYTALGHKLEAAVCWLNALWDADPMPGDWLAEWVRSEVPGIRGMIKADDFDGWLNKSGGMEDSRRVVSGFLWLATRDPVPPWLLTRLPAVQAYLEKNEDTLPVRAIWLAAYRLAQLAGADLLGLARVRDRLLQRLLDQGLQAERDLPSFLRYAGHQDSDRLRLVRDKATELHATVRKWTEHIPQNLPYVDLLFAFALAKLSEATQAKQLVEDARRVMQVSIPTSRNPQDDQKVTAAVISNFLFKAFKYRVDQALAGKPHTGQLAPELIAELDDIHQRSKSGPTNNPYNLTHYVISRMRDQSFILEPHEKLDPYAEWTKNQDPLKKELAELPEIREPTKLAERIRKLYRDGVPGRNATEVRLLVLHAALPLAPRVGEAFTVELLQLVPPALMAVTPGSGPEPLESLQKQGTLLDRSLFLAGHFNRGELVNLLVDSFAELVHRKPEETRYTLINIVAGQCLRSLKRLGMRNDIDRFLTRLHTEVLCAPTLADLKRKYANKPEMWAAVLQTLLHLAAGWMSFEWFERAKVILEESRNELLNPQAVKIPPKDYTELARAYVRAVAHLHADEALVRITELFRKMDQKRITNTWTTAQYYSRFHLNLVEDVIQALASDEFALGSAGRKWLDEDEYLVRRRIHADMKRERERSGL